MSKRRKTLLPGAGAGPSAEPAGARRRARTAVPAALPGVVSARAARWPVRILWVALMAVVVIFVMVELPQTRFGGHRLRRSERRQLDQAEAMGGENLPRAAADAYAAIADDARASTQARTMASERLADIHLKMNEPRQAAEAMEKAVFQSGGAEERARLQARLEELRTKFADQLAGEKPLGAEDSFKAAADADKSMAIAEIGGRKITVDEVMYAWSRSRQGEASNDAKLHEFTVGYLNDALYAEEARRRGLDARPGYRMETRLQAQKLLAQGVLSEAMGDATGDAFGDALKAYYEEHKSEYLTQPMAKIGHIVVREPEASAEVARRLAAGEAFETVAGAMSLDADSLTDHMEIGVLSGNEGFIPYVGSMPELAKKLVLLDDGATTSPIVSPRGLHTFKILEKHGAEPKPLEEVKEQVTRRFRAEQSKKAQEKLLTELRAKVPTKVHEDALKTAMEMYRQKEKLAAEMGKPGAGGKAGRSAKRGSPGAELPAGFGSIPAAAAEAAPVEAAPAAPAEPASPAGAPDGKAGE